MVHGLLIYFLASPGAWDVTASVSAAALGPGSAAGNLG